MAALTLLKLWLTSWQQVQAQGSARFDDFLFVELAEHLKHGDWLGPYTERSLVKGPVYPMWLAAVSLARIPLLPAQQLLHALATAAVVIAIGRLLPHRGGRLALFALLLFDPGTYETTTHRVTREGIYTSLALLILAAVIALSGPAKVRRWALWSATVFLGLIISAFWFTREEGPWILPAIAIPLAYVAFHRIRNETGLHRATALVPLALPFLILAAAHGALAQLNRQCYGHPATIELREPWFTHAYGSLTRVNPDHALWRVPVSAAARAQIYAASPAFAELKSPLEERARLAAQAAGASPDAAATPSEEMTGTWFVWALRDAVAAAGHHDKLPHARAYYERLAGEVDAACAEGRLICGPPHASLAPAWKPEYAEKSWRFFKRITNNLLSMRSLRVEQPPSESGSPQAMRMYTDLTHMRIEGSGGGSGNEFFLMSILQVLTQLYRGILYPAVIGALIAFAVGLAGDARKRAFSPRLLIAAALLAAVLTRIALLTYISASAYPIFHGIYLRVLYPLLYLFVWLSAADAIARFRQFRTGSTRTGGPRPKS